MYQRIPLSKDVRDDDIPEQCMIVCLNNSGQLIQKVKFNNVITIYNFIQHEQKVFLNMSVNEDTNNIDVSIHD